MIIVIVFCSLFSKEHHDINLDSFKLMLRGFISSKENGNREPQ